MLSAEQFAELIALIQVSEAHETQSSVRRAPRIESAGKTTITLVDTGDVEFSHEVQVKDISARGVCFHHTEFLKEGTAFILKLEGEGDQFASIFCVVVHTRAIDKHTFQVGAQFTKLINKKTGPVPPGATAQDFEISRSGNR